MDLALNNPERLICHKTQTTNQHHRWYSNKQYNASWKWLGYSKSQQLQILIIGIILVQ